tara:strand:- start:274 stop:960 length:687 start_codon:yes stop_codon:yes gene_type:complete
MSRVSRRKGISLKDKLETYHLSFDIDELKKSLEENLEKDASYSVFSNGKRCWINGNLPVTLQQIDRQIRKRFGIKDDNKLIALVHYPPEVDDSKKPLEKNLIIKENKPNVMSRFLISTTHEVCDVTIGSSQPDTLEFKSWVAIKTPEMIGGMLSYNFSNDKSLVIPAKKGFRQVRKSKKLDSRYIIVLDYLVSKNQLEEINQMLGNEKKEEGGEVDPRISEALKDLLA